MPFSILWAIFAWVSEMSFRQAGRSAQCGSSLGIIRATFSSAGAVTPRSPNSDLTEPAAAVLCARKLVQNFNTFAQFFPGPLRSAAARRPCHRSRATDLNALRQSVAWPARSRDRRLRLPVYFVRFATESAAEDRLPLVDCLPTPTASFLYGPEYPAAYRKRRVSPL